MPLSVFATIHARPGCEAQLRNGLFNLVAKVREEDACLLYELYESAEHPTHFIMHELWTDEAGLLAHEQMPHMKEFGELAKDWFAAPVELTKIAK
ncbi:antibiotic biosynthesis monooxygenase [Spirosoma taeanense]|uniref:Antibiotic biosynthesis monooxygenase n=1 Tax=Spirosoma taeanense TaxID=2735870 RepID=A0A6M5Y950_9BACT|nr:putative quinol monooxygenase [Spirosoma taeanense]QJW89723.1 antibiotic biosynthesis monooxygenase [Spirosoma taeanense]